MQTKTKIQGPFDVAKNALHQVEMRLPGGMHVEADLLDIMGDVRTCQGKIL
jgi:hypothetical protein